MSRLLAVVSFAALGACAGRAPLLVAEPMQDPVATEQDPEPEVPPPSDAIEEVEEDVELAEAEANDGSGSGSFTFSTSSRSGGVGDFGGSRPWKLIRMEHVGVLEEDQFHAGFTYEKNDESSAFGVTLDYGVTDRLTVQGKVGAGDQPNTLYLGEKPGVMFEAGAQYGFLADPDEFRLSGRLSAVLSDEESFEVMRPGETSTKVSVQPSLLFGAPLGQGVELLGEVGGRFGESTDPALVVGTALAVHVKRVTFLAEFDGSFQDDVDELYFAPGVVFNPRDKIQVRVGAPIGLTDESLDWRVMATLGVRF